MPQTIKNTHISLQHTHTQIYADREAVTAAPVQENERELIKRCYRNVLH